MKVEITPAKITDAREILELQKKAYASEAQLYNDFTIPPMVQTEEELGHEFSTLMILKALDRGKIIGSVRASLVGSTCAIGRLIVDPDFQGRGIGTQLMTAIEAAFPMAGEFELFTGEKSLKNLRLYEKLGYIRTGTKPLYSRVSIVFLAKRGGACGV